MEILALNKISGHRIVIGFEGAIKSLLTLLRVKDLLLSILQVRRAKASSNEREKSIWNTLANMVLARVFYCNFHIYYISIGFILSVIATSCNLLVLTHTLVSC